MIYYFSGTGNSRWVAKTLAKKICVSLSNIMDCNINSLPIDEEIFGIVFPVYAWGAPEPVIDFVKRLRGTPSFSFAICTCGSEAGYAIEKLTQIVSFDSMYSIAMPSNYILGADLEDKKSMHKKIDNAKLALDVIAAQIASRTSVKEVTEGSFPWIKSNLANLGFRKFGRNTKLFHATENCTSCMKCVKDCPANTIELINGKPKWGELCYQCMACINLCPERAIEYGKKTYRRGRYSLESLVVET